MTLLIALFTACAPTDKMPDTGGGGGGDDTGSTTTPGVCNTDNEDCGPYTCGGEGQNMLPGADCMACHTPGNLVDDKGVAKEDEDKYWTAAGTAFSDLDGTGPLQGATVRITGADGNTVTLRTNSVGNFYTTQRIVTPISAEIEANGQTYAMVKQPDQTNCNSCHSCSGEAGGKLFGL